MSSADRAAAAVRLANARACLLTLRENGDPQRVGEVARRTGLSRPTVDAVLQDLVEAGSVITHSPAEAGTPGRPARRFSFNPRAGLVAGVDVGVHRLRCRIADASGRVLRRHTVDATADGADRIDTVVHAVRQLTAGTGEGEAPLAAVGVALPGILDHDDRLVSSLAVPDWVGLDVGSALADRLNCPVAVENDIKLAAYAEHHVAAGTDDLIFLQIGHRISVAVIVGGRILQGSHRVAGELGSRRGMRWTSTSRRGELCWSTGHDAEELFTRAGAGDQQARQEIDRFCAEIAPTITTLLLAVDPDLVVVGGGLSQAGSTLLDPLRRAVHELLMVPDKPDFRTARLTLDGAVVGALGQAFERHSAAVVGIGEVPPPWPRLSAGPDRHPAPIPGRARTADTVPALTGAHH